MRLRALSVALLALVLLQLGAEERRTAAPVQGQEIPDHGGGLTEWPPARRELATAADSAAAGAATTSGRWTLTPDGTPVGDLVFYKGYTAEQVLEEQGIRANLLPQLASYYGVAPWNVPAQTIYRWANLVSGGLTPGQYPLDAVQLALSRSLAGRTTEYDRQVFLEYHVRRYDGDTHETFWAECREQYGFGPEHLLANRMVVEDFGSFHRDPLLYEDEGIRFSFIPGAAPGGEMFALRLDYDVSTADHHALCGFYIQLPGQDLSSWGRLAFFVKGGARQGPRSPIPFGRQDPNAGYTRSFTLTFKDSAGATAEFVVTGVRQDEWIPVIITSDSIAGTIDWSCVVRVAITFYDVDCLPDKDGAIYLAGFVDHPQEWVVDNVASNICRKLERFYRSDEEQRQVFLRRFGLEGQNYTDMSPDEVEALYYALVAEPDVIIGSGVLALYDAISHELPGVSVVDVVVRVLLPRILRGEITVGSIIEGTASVSGLDWARLLNERPPGRFFLSDTVDVLKTTADIVSILTDAVAYAQALTEIVEFAHQRGLCLYVADFMPDAVGADPAVPLRGTVVSLDTKATTLADYVPFVAQLGTADRREYVLVTALSRSRRLGGAVLFVHYIDSAGMDRRVPWAEFETRWLHGRGLGLICTLPTAVLADGSYALVQRLEEKTVTLKLCPDGTRVVPRDQFDLAVEYVLSSTRSYGETVACQEVASRVAQTAAEWARLAKPVLEADSWYHHPDGLPYQAYNAIKGDTFYSSPYGWLTAMPRGATNVDPLRLFFHQEEVGLYREIVYAQSQYDYRNRYAEHYAQSLADAVGIDVNLGDVPPDAQYIADLRLGHRMSGGKYPLVLDISGNGFARVTAFPPYAMGASVRFGLHSVGGTAVAGNPGEERFSKFEQVYVSPAGDEWELLVLVNDEAFTGALAITLVPGRDTELHVSARYYLKRDVLVSEDPNVGFVGFSSMFFSGERGEKAHDSDLLVVHHDDGTSVSRELANPCAPTMWTSPPGTRSFALLQTERNSNAFSTAFIGDEFHRRCSYYVELVGSSISDFTVKLYEFPTTGITVDNVVVFLSPEADLLQGDVIDLTYVIRAGH